MKPFPTIGALAGLAMLLVGCVQTPSQTPTDNQGGTAGGTRSVSMSGQAPEGWVQVQGQYTPFALYLPENNTYVDYTDQGPSALPTSAETTGPVDVWARPTMAESLPDCTMTTPCYNVAIGTSNAKNFAGAVSALKTRNLAGAGTFTVSELSMTMTGASNIYATLATMDNSQMADWDYITVVAEVAGTTYILTLSYMVSAPSSTPSSSQTNDTEPSSSSPSTTTDAPVPTGKPDDGGDSQLFFEQMAVTVQQL